MLYAIRFSVPDRPGTLGSVASAVSHIPASIVTLAVVERDDLYAVDEMCVECADTIASESLRRTIESIPGVVVEAVRRVSRAPDPLAPLELADRLAGVTDDPTGTLVTGLPDALQAAWAICLDVRDGLTVPVATPGAPVPQMMDTPWLPLDGARRLEHADWMPPRWRMSRFELAAVALDEPYRCIVVGRWSGMRFRPTELRQLDLLAGLAVGRLALQAV